MSSGDTRIRTRIVPHRGAKNALLRWKWQVRPPSTQSWTTWQTGTAMPNTPYLRFEWCLDQKNPGPPYTSGGPFKILKADIDPFQETARVSANSGNATTFVSGFGNVHMLYSGPIYSPNYSGLDMSDSAYSGLASNIDTHMPSLSSWRPKVFKRLKPKISQAEPLVALAEIREIPRMLRQTAGFMRNSWNQYVALAGSRSNLSRRSLRTAKRVPNDFLNYQFGWVPFVKDIVDLTRTTLFLDSYLQDLKRRNNIWDHRETTLAHTQTLTKLAEGTENRCQPTGIFFDTLVDSSSSGYYRHEFYLDETLKIWASGDFRFYLPEFDMTLPGADGMLSDLQRHLRVYGVHLSPSVLWNITPWTWAIDWFTNVGNLIENFDAVAQDQVVSKNLFLMCTKVKSIRLKQTIRFKSGTHAFDFQRLLTTKQREKSATPFDFGLSGDLTTRQYAIAAAVGLGQLRRL